MWEIISKGDPPDKPPTPVYSRLFAIWTGDVIDASVTKRGSSYVFVIHDHRGWTWKSTKVQKDGGATPATAEWIVERGTPAGAALTPFGTVTFTGCNYSDARGSHNLNVRNAMAVVAVGSNGPLTSVSGHGNTITVQHLRRN